MESKSSQNTSSYSFWKIAWLQFQKHRIGFAALIVVILFALVGIYAPFLASSKPIFVNDAGTWYFPLFRYLFYAGFYTKPIDLFYNIFMFVLPVGLLLAWCLKKYRKQVILGMFLSNAFIFILLMLYKPLDPASDPLLEKKRQEALVKRKEKLQDPLLAPFTSLPSWQFDLTYMNAYAKLNLALREKIYFEQHQSLKQAALLLRSGSVPGNANDVFIPSMWSIGQKQEQQQKQRLERILSEKQEAYSDALKQIPALTEAYVNSRNDGTVNHSDSARIKLANARKIIQEYRDTEAKLAYLVDRREWLQKQVQDLHGMVMPLFRPFHWEDDAGGSQEFNQYVNWWQLTRTNRKDLVAALIFGIRVSLVVGVTAVVFALAIGVPMGGIAGYFGGKSDLLICRLMEIWEAMPTFFMLLLVVAITQSKSIFLVITVLGIFGWINIARFMRGEVLKQRNLTYVEACHSMGFKSTRIIFSHILPNAIPPVLTLLPFAVMGAIISEAGLSFLGLGEEGSSSWGVLMDEGRSAFPGESYLLWPPSLLLTILLVAIALVGDALRDALDPKMQ